VLHLAAQAGVRYSIDQPDDYTDSNLLGFGNILQGCRKHQVEHLVYASSSSVYGGNTKMPFAESDAVDHPISYYAATKKANELMAHTYRTCTAYPPQACASSRCTVPGDARTWPCSVHQGHPGGRRIDGMAAQAGARLHLYRRYRRRHHARVLDKPATPDASYDSQHPNPGTSTAPYRIFNIGNNSPTVLMDYIAAIEAAMQNRPQANAAHTARRYAQHIGRPGPLQAWVGFSPAMPVVTGVQRFVDWYRSFYRV
jgi:UDP-glucuronate 4-epimerase